MGDILNYQNGLDITFIRVAVISSSAWMEGCARDYQNPLRLIRAIRLMNSTAGDSRVKIGIVDGQIDTSHPSLSGMRIVPAMIGSRVSCISKKSSSCFHATFIAGILGGKRGSSVPAICPNCTYIFRPIFVQESPDARFDISETTPDELAKAIFDTVNAGAKVINLSLGLSEATLTHYRTLVAAYDYARSCGTLVVVAAGNQGNMGYNPLLDHDWIIPVGSCTQDGKLSPDSNFGPTIGSRGLMAPGTDIQSSAPSGRYAKMSGSSLSAAFVTGSLALLWSIFPAVNPSILRDALLLTRSNRYRAVIPRLLDVEASMKYLSARY